MSSFQTMESWSIEVKSFEQLPEFFQDAFRGLFSLESVFPHTVYTPGFKFGQSSTNPTIITVDDSRLIVLEMLQGEIKQNSFSLIDINYVEHGAALLRSWFTVSGSIDGKLVSANIEYNTVSQPLFDSIIKKVRLSSNVFDETLPVPETEQFEYLFSKDFAFSNYAKLSILQGEKVIRHVYEHNVNYLTYMAILTDKELIVLKDDILDRTKFGKYGIIRQYMPINRIRSIAIQKNPVRANGNNILGNDLILELSVHLHKKDALSYPFTMSNMDALESLVDEFEKIAS